MKTHQIKCPLFGTKGLVLFACSLFSLFSTVSHAGFFEISANGSYFKYNNGLIGGEPSTTTTTKYSAGFAYRLAASTAIELNYTHSKNLDIFAQDITSEDQKFLINKATEFDNLSLDLVLNFAGKSAPFKPYIRGGLGYMVRKVALSGTAIDKVTNIETALTFADQPDIPSASGETGIGFKFMLTDSLALDANYTVYFTDLNKPEIYLHYSAAGGLRLIF